MNTRIRRVSSDPYHFLVSSAFLVLINTNIIDYHMPRKKRRGDDLIDLAYDFARGRVSSIRLINKLIDHFFEDKKYIDLPLHFLNEAVLHRNPELFIQNFLRYEVLKTRKR